MIQATVERIGELTWAEIVPCEGKKDWLARRVIGGSSSPNLFGCGYASEYSMWADFMAPPEYVESTQRQKIGLGLESFVCALYEEEYGGEIEQWPAWTLAKHYKYEYMHATPDGVIFDSRLGNGPGSFSIKTWSEYDKKSWSMVFDDDSGESYPQIPLYVQIQLQHELACLGWQWGVVAVLFGAQELRRYYFERNDYFIEQLYAACGKFWRYVTDKIAPPIDESIASREAWARLHPDDNGCVVRLPHAADAIILELEDAKAQLKSAKALEAARSNTLRTLLGDNSYGVSPEGRVYSLKAQDRKEKCCEGCGNTVMAGATFRVLRKTKGVPNGAIWVDGDPIQGLIDYSGSKRKAIDAETKRVLFGNDNRCHWCRAPLTLAKATIEHLVPLSLGGTNEINNLTLACDGCNQARGNDATLTAPEIVVKKKAAKEKPKPKPKLTAALWACQNCGVDNPGFRVTCMGCETAR